MKHILIADDRMASRELIRTMLESAGYSVDEAANGAEVLKQIAERTPDLVLLDLHMPVMDGFATVREIRRLPCCLSLPVIALTASAMSGDRERAIEEGFTHYISKPVRFHDLRRQLKDLLPDA
jgi:CheY-like chemotaxis protein